MKSLKFLLCLGLAAVGAQAASNCPMAQWPAAYSVETETTANGTKSAMKMFVDGDKTRSEIDANGMQMISIIRKDKKMSYSLMPAQKMVMDNPLQDAPAAAAPAGAEPVWEKIGSEKVNGQDCTVYTVKSGGTVTTYYLGSDKLPVRLKTDAMTMDYKNFKAGAQDAALFEVPAGYTKPGEAPAAGSDNSGASASNASSNSNSGGTVAPAGEPEKPAKKKGKLGGMLGR